MPQGLYGFASTDDDDDSTTAKPGIWTTVKRPVLAWAAASAAAALLAGTGFVDAATALDGGLGATVGIIAASNLMPTSTVAQWALPIAVPALVGMTIDGPVVGAGIAATLVYRQQMN